MAVMMTRVVQGSALAGLCALVIGCASSNVERQSASNVDMGVMNANSLANSGDTDIADSYQNSTQATKGVMLGGATGGIVGTFVSGVGFLPGALTGALLGGGYGSYIDSQTTYTDKLINRGADVITLGDQVMVVMNSSRLFNGVTDELKSTSYSTLDVLASFINSQTKILVKISAYTDDVGSSSVNLITSQKQAEAIERYLAASGVNARLLVAEGFGGTNLVAKNQEDWSGSDNYRIEITLEKLHA